MTTIQNLHNLGFRQLELNDKVFERTEGYPAVVYVLQLPALERTIETTTVKTGEVIKFTVSNFEGDIIQRIETTPDEEFNRCIVALIASNNLLRRIKKSAFGLISKMH